MPLLLWVYILSAHVHVKNSICLAIYYVILPYSALEFQAVYIPVHVEMLALVKFSQPVKVLKGVVIYSVLQHLHKINY